MDLYEAGASDFLSDLSVKWGLIDLENRSVIVFSARNFSPACSIMLELFSNVSFILELLSEVVFVDVLFNAGNTNIAMIFNMMIQAPRHIESN